MVLLDTCTLLWLVASPRSLSAHARELIRKQRGRLFVSAISALELLTPDPGIRAYPDVRVEW